MTYLSLPCKFQPVSLCLLKMSGSSIEQKGLENFGNGGLLSFDTYKENPVSRQPTDLFLENFPVSSAFSGAGKGSTFCVNADMNCWGGG